MDFEDIQDCLAEFNKSKWHATDSEDATNINLDSFSLLLQDKQSGNKYNKNEDLQVKPYGKNKANKSTEESAIKQKGNCEKKN